MIFLLFYGHFLTLIVIILYVLFQGAFCKSLSSLKPSDLGSIVIKECLERAKLKPSDVSEVIMGQVNKKIIYSTDKH